MATGTIDVIIGLDVGKSNHHACALTVAGEILYDKSLPQDETHLLKVFTGLQPHGTVLVGVDQLNTIGALPIAVARDIGCQVGYLQGLAMRKAADLHPGRFKTDRRDASHSSPIPPAPCHTCCGPSTATTRCCRPRRCGRA